MIRITLRWRHLGYVAAAVAALGLVFWFTAPYSISARAKHVPGVGYALHKYLKHWVRSRTLLSGVPSHVDIGSDALKRLGAGHYESGCAVCHGAPGSPRNPVARKMNPPPTDLAEVQYSAPGFHLIGYNGFRYSGMPAWAGDHREDEVWAIAAFLDDYRDMTPERYLELAYGDTLEGEPAPGTASPFGMVAGEVDLAASCMRCHGTDGRGRDGTAPVLAGQDAEYLRAALDAYADDARQSGFMEPLAAALDEGERSRLAQEFATMEGGLGEVELAASGEGARLAREGDESRDIPACSGCHGAERKEGWPKIVGQSEHWIATWLRLWRERPHGALGQGDKMRAAARHLSDEDIAALAAYYAGGTE